MSKNRKRRPRRGALGASRTPQQRKLGKCARSCKGKRRGAFKSCMRSCLRK